MSFSRRGFVVGCSSAIAAMAGGRVSNLVFGADSASRDILVTVFLRGGCDALSLVAPSGDADYQSSRLNLLVKQGDPSTDANSGWQLNNGLAPVDFRLHNKARPLHELYVSGDMAIIHACGLTNGTRSHFDAMDYIERGTPTNKSTSSGWIARHLRSIGLVTDTPGQLPTVAASANLPTTMLGSPIAMSLSKPADFRLSRHWKYGDAQKAALRSFYNGTLPLHSAGATTLASIDAIDAKLPKDSNGNPLPYTPETETGKEYPTDWYVSGFKDSLQCIAQLIKMDVGLQIASVDYGGWDTHQDQAYVFPRQVDGMARALAAFYNDVRNYHARLTVVVISEFGRRLRSNDSGGTDHGHGGMMLVMGGNVKGGRMYGKWPGLAVEQLDNRVDLQVTTDFRTVLSEVLVRRLANPSLGQIFPGITPEVYSTSNRLDFLNGADLAVDYSNTYGTVYLPMVRR
jgi:uncharacterized protein (DUF1501 family)